MRPGARFESIEIDYQPRCDDGTLPPDSAVHRWWQLQLEATRGKSIAYPDMVSLLQRAGFTGVHCTSFPLPFHRWMKGWGEVGDSVRAMLTQNDPFTALSMAPFTRNLGWFKDEVEAFVREVHACADTLVYHGYFQL